MRTNIKNTWKSILLAAIALPLVAAKPVQTANLAVKIETPSVFDISDERDITESLLNHLDTTFKRAGFEGHITSFDRLDEELGNIPVINLRITDWNTRRTGMVECRFTAEISRPDGSIEKMGSFRGSAMTWNRRDRFTTSRAFEDAAVRAMRDLYRDFEKLDTVPTDEAKT